MDFQINPEWRTSEGRFKCPCCKKEYALTALIGHMKRSGCMEMIESGKMMVDENGNYIMNPDEMGNM